MIPQSTHVPLQHLMLHFWAAVAVSAGATAHVHYCMCACSWVMQVGVFRDGLKAERVPRKLIMSRLLGGLGVTTDVPFVTGHFMR